MEVNLNKLEKEKTMTKEKTITNEVKIIIKNCNCCPFSVVVTVDGEFCFLPDWLNDKRIMVKCSEFRQTECPFWKNQSIRLSNK